MKTSVQLTAETPSQVINLNAWTASKMLISNPTGSPVAIRLGGNDIPSMTNADQVCPGGGYLVIPVDGGSFAAGFTNPSLATSIVSSNLGNRATIVLMDQAEETPNFGAASFQSISTSQLSNGAQAFSPAPPALVYDLGSYGGALFYFNPAGSSGQTQINLNISNDGTTWYPLALYGLWPGIPTVINVPRLMRYVNLEFWASGIAGEPAPAGTFYARASLEEITDLRYTPIGTSISKSFSIAALGTQRYTFITAGLPAITVGLNFTTGTAGELLLEASESPNGPWRLVEFREQITSGTTYNSIYRSVGNLALYTRVSILETGNNAGGLIGTASLLINPESDLTSVLERIYAALGDVGNSSSVGQSIFSQLARIYNIENTYQPHLAQLVPISGNSSTLVTNTNPIPTYLSNLAQLVPISGNSSTLVTNTNPIPTYLANLAQLPNIAGYTANLNSLQSYHTAATSSGPSTFLNMPSPGTWQVVAGIFAAGYYIYSCQMSFQANFSSSQAQTTVMLGIGDAVTVRRIIYNVTFHNPTLSSGTQIWGGVGPVVSFVTAKTGGIVVAANETYVWVQTSTTPGGGSYNIVYSA